MKSKLTLRIRSRVKAEAKAIAAQRGTSVSQMVETYFQMLAGPKSADTSEEINLTTGDDPTGDDPNRDVPDGNVPNGNPSTGDAPDAASKRTVDLSPRIQALQATLGQPAPDIDLDADTQQWVDHAVKKHT